MGIIKTLLISLSSSLLYCSLKNINLDVVIRTFSGGFLSERPRRHQRQILFYTHVRWYRLLIVLTLDLRADAVAAVAIPAREEERYI